MATFLTYLLGLLVVGGALFLLASFAFGRGEEMAPMRPDGTPVELPDGRPVVGDDVRGLRLSVVLRGYRMHEVDWVLDQLAAELDERDREIARLRGEPAPTGPAHAESASARLAHAESAPSGPAHTGPAPTGPAPTGPAPTGPAHAEPGSAGPAHVSRTEPADDGGGPAAAPSDPDGAAGQTAGTDPTAPGSEVPAGPGLSDPDSGGGSGDGTATEPVAARRTRPDSAAVTPAQPPWAAEPAEDARDG